MALALASAPHLKPNIKLSQALKEFESILPADQKLQRLPPSPNAVMALTCDIDRQNAGRKTRRYGARLTSFLNSVKGFTSVVDTIIGSTGNPIAGAVWGTVKTAIQAASGFEAYFDSLSSMLMNVGLSSPRLEKYALLYPYSTSYQEELCNYYAVVVKLCTRIVLFVRKSTIKQIAAALRKPFEDEFGQLQKDLLRLSVSIKEELSLAAKVQQNTDSIEASRERKENWAFRATGTAFQLKTSKELEHTRKWRVDRTKQQFLKSCSTYNWETTLSQTRKKGASTWIFDCDAYQRFKSSDFSANLLCSGIVGSGQTVICANVTQDLTLETPPHSSLASFFCRSDEATSLKAREIVGSLARQLLEDLPSGLFACVRNDRGLGDVPFNTERLVSYVDRLLPKANTIYLILDGLDECQQEDLDMLASALLDLMGTLRRNVKLFWTGRPDLLSRVSSPLNPDHHIQITPSKNGHEVKEFIGYKLETALATDKLKLRDPNIIIKIRDALEAGACEMFLWVAFQVDSICTFNTDQQILNSLDDMPKGLPAIFRRILCRLRQSFSADPVLGKRIFEIVAAAQRPLTLNELGEAISIKPGNTRWSVGDLVTDVMKCLESCGSFVVVDEEASTVHFAHSSVKRHLSTKPTDVDIDEYHINLAKADHKLGAIVVTYLNLDALGGTLTKSQRPLQSYASNIPAEVLKSAIPKYDTAKRLALSLLRNRKMPDYDPEPDLEVDVRVKREKESYLHDSFTFFSYCQQYWLHHTQTIEDGFPGNPQNRIFELWKLLMHGSVTTVEVPWAPENLAECGQQFLDWVSRAPHPAAMSVAIYCTWEKLCWAEKLTVGRNDEIVPMDDFEYIAELDRLLYKCIARLDKPLTIIQSTPSTKSLITDTDFKGGYKQITVGYLLIIAAQNQALAVVEFALLQGADVDAKDLSYNYKTALYHAAVLGQDRLAKLLITSGATNVNAVTRVGNALLVAVTKGNVSVLELLIQKGAKVNVVGGQYGTALITAVQHNEQTCLKTLLTAGADIEQLGCDPACPTALITAAAVKPNSNCLRILLKAGAKVNKLAVLGDEEVSSRTYHPQTAIQAALMNNNQETIRTLLDAGADVNQLVPETRVLGVTHQSPWMMAVRSRDESLFQLMFDHGAAIDDKLGSVKAYKSKYKTSQRIAEMLFKHFEPEEAAREQQREWNNRIGQKLSAERHRPQKF